MKISESGLNKLKAVMEEKNLSVAQVIKLVKKNNVQNQKIINPNRKIRLVVDYPETIEQVITDSQYKCERSEINTENFPIPPKMIGKKVEVFAKLFHFNNNMISEDVIYEMSKTGYWPATLIELLALGSQFPEL